MFSSSVFNWAFSVPLVNRLFRHPLYARGPFSRVLVFLPQLTYEDPLPSRPEHPERKEIYGLVYRPKGCFPHGAAVCTTPSFPRVHDNPSNRNRTTGTTTGEKHPTTLIASSWRASISFTSLSPTSLGFVESPTWI